MVKMKSKIMTMLAAILLISIMAIPSYAAGSSSGGIINITPSSSGISISPGTAPDMTGAMGSIDDVGNTVITKTQAVAKTVAAICTIICFIAFLISITKLATSGSHPMQRRAAIIGILWSGVALTLFGGGWVVVSFFWNFLN